MTRRGYVTLFASVTAMGCVAIGMLLSTPTAAAGSPSARTLAASGRAGLEPLADPTQQQLVTKGAALYETNCASCHGAAGVGRTKGAAGGEAVGPSLRGVGEASAYYQMSTGRMPLTDVTGQAQRKPRVFDDEETAALVAYVASLGDGPSVPTLDLDAANLANGGELFRANCAPCHSAAGSGGALSYGTFAPNLHRATAKEVAAAVRAGPGQMPFFNRHSLSDAQLNDVARYVEYLRNPSNRGGIPLGRTGPVPEGFVAWVLGIGSLVGAAFWIGTRERKATP